MATTGTAPAKEIFPAVFEQKVHLQARVRNGAGWMAAIALFSVINSVLVASGANINFIVGLGITRVADEIAQKSGTLGHAAAFVVSMFMAALFCVFWRVARGGQKWAFNAGMVLYAADALIFLAAGMMLNLAFHGFAIYSIYQGLAAANKLAQLEAAASRSSAAAAGRP